MKLVLVKNKMMQFSYLPNCGFHQRGFSGNPVSMCSPSTALISPSTNQRNHNNSVIYEATAVPSNYQAYQFISENQTFSNNKSSNFSIESILGLTSQPFDLSSTARDPQIGHFRLKNIDKNGMNFFKRTENKTVKYCKKSQQAEALSKKPKRIRTIFTPEQLEMLEREFERQQYMVGPERIYLASTLNLTEAQVKVWFQNRRIKWRKQHLELEQAQLAKLRRTNEQ